MRETQLPNPGRINRSLQLRREVVNAISYMQVSKRPDGKHPAAADVEAFLTAALTAVGLLKQGYTAPVCTVNPAVTGTAKVGNVLTSTGGTWTGYTAPVLTYQWRRGGTAIPGATSPTYTCVTEDIDALMSCRVTGTNPHSAVSVNSNNTSAVIA